MLPEYFNSKEFWFVFEIESMTSKIEERSLRTICRSKRANDLVKVLKIGCRLAICFERYRSMSVFKGLSGYV